MYEVVQQALGTEPWPDDMEHAEHRELVEMRVAAIPQAIEELREQGWRDA
jgi:hypothetical protein